VTEHRCEANTNSREGCGKPARFKVQCSYEGVPYWRWVCADHYDEIMREKEKRQ
jgi:hypothetical protein